MKFYRDNLNYYYWDKIIEDKLTAIYFRSMTVLFLKNGKEHNAKNTARVSECYKKFHFHLNGKYYGNHYKFNKKSWRRFVKLKAFL